MLYIEVTQIMHAYLLLYL